MAPLVHKYSSPQRQIGDLSESKNMAFSAPASLDLLALAATVTEAPL